MLPIHLAIGLAEGFVTAGVIRYLKKYRPEVMTTLPGPADEIPTGRFRRTLLIFLVLAFFTGGLSWFASTNPDGLEWSIEKVYGRPELPEQEDRITGFLGKIQNKTAIFPDYTFRPRDKKAGENPAGAESDVAATVAGSFFMILLIWIIGMSIKTAKRK
jgi:cobalt/nickel transport system permease protein